MKDYEIDFDDMREYQREAMELREQFCDGDEEHRAADRAERIRDIKSCQR